MQSCQFCDLFTDFNLNFFSFIRNRNAIADIDFNLNIDWLTLAVLLSGDAFYTFRSTAPKDTVNEITFKKADVLYVREALEDDTLEYLISISRLKVVSGISNSLVSIFLGSFLLLSFMANDTPMNFYKNPNEAKLHREIDKEKGQFLPACFRDARD